MFGKAQFLDLYVKYHDPGFWSDPRVDRVEVRVFNQEGNRKKKVFLERGQEHWEGAVKVRGDKGHISFCTLAWSQNILLYQGNDWTMLIGEDQEIGLTIYPLMGCRLLAMGGQRSYRIDPQGQILGWGKGLTDSPVAKSPVHFGQRSESGRYWRWIQVSVVDNGIAAIREDGSLWFHNGLDPKGIGFEPLHQGKDWVALYRYIAIDGNGTQWSLGSKVHEFSPHNGKQPPKSLQEILLTEKHKKQKFKTIGATHHLIQNNTLMGSMVFRGKGGALEGFKYIFVHLARHKYVATSKDFALLDNGFLYGPSEYEKPFFRGPLMPQILYPGENFLGLRTLLPINYPLGISQDHVVVSLKDNFAVPQDPKYNTNHPASFGNVLPGMETPGGPWFPVFPSEENLSALDTPYFWLNQEEEPPPVHVFLVNTQGEVQGFGDNRHHQISDSILEKIPLPVQLEWRLLDTEGKK